MKTVWFVCGYLGTWFLAGVVLHVAAVIAS